MAQGSKNGQERALEKILGDLPLFTQLTPGELTRLAGGCRLRTFERDAVLLREGDQASGMYFVLKGMVKVVGSGPDGREVVLHLVRPGNTLGEAALFQRGTFPATALAVREVEALYLDGRTLLDMVTANPDLALRMLAALSLRLRMFTRKLTAQIQGGAAKRLAAYLLHRSEMNDGASLIKLGVSRDVLAGLLGLARETLSRKLGVLVAAGAIRLQGRDIVIEDADLLREIAEGDE